MASGQFETLVVDLSRRLPDVDKVERIPFDLERFGRCAVLQNGGFWFGEANTSHPLNTKEGFYWGIVGNRLYISPRGSTFGWAKHVTIEFVRELARQAGIRAAQIQFVLATDSD